MEPGLTVVRVPLDALTPHPRNVREGDVGAIAKSLREFGQYRPIVVQKGTDPLTIIAGTHTWLAHRALRDEAVMDKRLEDVERWSTIDTVPVDADDETAVRIMLADNRTHDLGRDREDELAALLGSLGERSWPGTGWDGDDLDTLLRDLGTYDPAAAILTAFEDVAGTDREKAFLHGRDEFGNDLYIIRLSLTEAQRDDVIAAFAKAKRLGTPTQPEALALIARKYLEDAA